MDHLNDPRAVRLLLELEHGADPNIPAQDGSTPLHRASQKGMIKIIRLLIEYGVSVEAQDDEGRTPLDVASGEQREEIIKLLLEHLAT
jgi:ankyrin repeat protein